MRAYGISDIGKVRESNQDCFAVSVSGAVPVWAVVCDGMGGANGGYYASSTSVGVFSHSMDISFEGLKSKQVENVMREATENANADIYRTSIEQPDLSGMGTTLVAAVVLGDSAHIAHVGDSRAYKIGDGKIERLTTDHSVVQQLVELGKLSEQEARNHPEKNMITRAVGVKESVEVDTTTVKLRKNDALLLCTDGLSNLVSEEEMLDIVSTTGHEEAAELLISLALTRGGSDNVTAVIIRD